MSEETAVDVVVGAIVVGGNVVVEAGVEGAVTEGGVLRCAVVIEGGGRTVVVTPVTAVVVLAGRVVRGGNVGGSIS